MQYRKNEFVKNFNKMIQNYNNSYIYVSINKKIGDIVPRSAPKTLLFHIRTVY